MDEEFQGIKAMLDGFALMAAQMEAKMAVMQAQLEEIDGDFPQQIIVDMGGGGSSAYNSYFRVINDGGNIGVTDGGTSTTGNCGTVKINGLRADVAAVSVSKSAGSYWVWIHSYIDADGDAYAVILITSTAATPTHTYGGVAYGSQLAGRVIIDEASVMTITQDYLHGGEHTEILIGDCDGGAVVEA